MKTLLLACVLVLASVPAVAQTPTVPANTAFSVVADHADGATAATGFRCYLDGAKVGNDLPASARVAGKVTCNMPGQSAGAHTVQMSAFNAVGETRSTSLSLTSVAPPSPPTAPTNLQIALKLAVAADGTVTLQAFSVEKQP